jgi:hypothetical protein
MLLFGGGGGGGGGDSRACQTEVYLNQTTSVMTPSTQQGENLRNNHKRLLIVCPLHSRF